MLETLGEGALVAGLAGVILTVFADPLALISA